MKSAKSYLCPSECFPRVSVGGILLGCGLAGQDVNHWRVQNFIPWVARYAMTAHGSGPKFLQMHSRAVMEGTVRTQSGYLDVLDSQRWGWSKQRTPLSKSFTLTQKSLGCWLRSQHFAGMSSEGGFVLAKILTKSVIWAWFFLDDKSRCCPPCCGTLRSNFEWTHWSPLGFHKLLHQKRNHINSTPSPPGIGPWEKVPQ